MEWIADYWGFLVPLVISMVVNIVVAVKLQSAKEFVLTVLRASADKKITDEEKIKIYDAFVVMAKDVFAVLKGITPWKSK